MKAKFQGAVDANENIDSYQITDDALLDFVEVCRETRRSMRQVFL
eukprot:SAG11_NODE_34355_length_272_cov_0.901734_1_plen_44_part_01